MNDYAAEVLAGKLGNGRNRQAAVKQRAYKNGRSMCLTRSSVPFGFLQLSGLRVVVRMEKVVRFLSERFAEPGVVEGDDVGVLVRLSRRKRS